MEWKSGKKYNPFNSYKLLAHVNYWKSIRRGELVPPPLAISLDPSNKCNLNCKWCNAQQVRNRGRSISRNALIQLARFFSEWGVKTVCVGGGGEPTLNPHSSAFVHESVDNGVFCGWATNGTRINDHIDAMCRSTFVGVSLDSGTRETYVKLRGIDMFDQIVRNIESLTNASARAKDILELPNLGNGVTLKYLAFPENVHEIYNAAEMAKKIGCKAIHIRPANTPWYNLTKFEISYTDKQIIVFDEQVNQAFDDLDDETFSIYAIKHKVGQWFVRCNTGFKKCHAIFMQPVVQPPSENASEDAVTMSLCIDRRGDHRVEPLPDITDFRKIYEFWGSKEHWSIHDQIIPTECPRCTMGPHNEIYERVCIDDDMTYMYI
jgi:MoaA/NifB/PqqE/SkfB family radical SAM enzyme